MRLFLCDDNPQYRQLVRLVLERSGYQIVGEAADGREALERAPETDAEVLLLDLNMPGVNGMEALPRLREALPGTTLLVLTTWEMQDERERALAAGADGFILKPPRVSELEEKLRGALESAGS